MQAQISDPLAPLDTGGPSVQQGRDTQAPAPSFDPGKLYDSWNQWIDKPNNRAALMQFGIAMLQPVGMGETGVSHFANALGYGGEAAQRVTAQQQAQERHESDIDTRETRARAAETSAGAAETRALYAGQNAELRAQRDQSTNLARALTAQATARSKYDNYRLVVPEKQQLPYSEWIKTPEGMEALTGGAAGATTPPAISPTSPGPPGGAGTAKQALNHPQFQTMFQSARTAAASGNPGAIQAVKQQLLSILGPSMAPGEMQLLFNQLGIK